jgi:hypothetical protein
VWHWQLGTLRAAGQRTPKMEDWGG